MPAIYVVLQYLLLYKHFLNDKLNWLYFLTFKYETRINSQPVEKNLLQNFYRHQECKSLIEGMHTDIKYYVQTLSCLYNKQYHLHNVVT